MQFQGADFLYVWLWTVPQTIRQVRSGIFLHTRSRHARQTRRHEGSTTARQPTAKTVLRPLAKSDLEAELGRGEDSLQKNLSSVTYRSDARKGTRRARPALAL